MSVELHVNGSVVTVPPWMQSLSQVQVDKLKSINDGKQRIIATGFYSNETLLTFLTLDLQIFEFDPTKYFLPLGRFLPTEDGLQVYLPNDDGRWSQQVLQGFHVEAEWLISVSKLSLTNPTLELNNRYIGDFLL